MAEKLKVKDIINTKLADDNNKGDCIYNEIVELSKKTDEITVDFEGIQLVNTAFLNNAIGRLFNSKEFDLTKSHITITHLGSDMMPLLKESIKVAKLKYMK